MNRKKESYIVPDVPLKEIIQYFSELQINIKTAEILQPNMNSCIKIYESILEAFKGERTSDMLSSQNLYDESVLPLVLYKRINEFMKNIGIHNFSHKDIFSPETKRLISHLSAIVNFSIFRDNKRDIYVQIQNNHSEREILKRELMNDIAVNEKKILDLEEKHRRINKENEAVSAEIQTLEEEIKQINRVQRDKIEQINNLKIEKQELQDKISSEQLISLNLRDEITRLKTQIVSDPGKMRELLSEMKLMVSREKETLKMFEEEYRNKNLAIEQEQECVENFKKAIKIAVQINEEVKKIKEVSNELAILDSLLRSNSTFIEGQKRRIENIERQISHIESKISNLGENDKKISEVICGQMEVLKNDYNKISERRFEQAKILSNNMKKLKDIDSLTIKRDNEFNSHVSKLKNEILELGECVFEYFNDFNIYFK
ncbi:putative kinetochore protein NUF2 [Dictyocoela muelleri]|nr:putative kinetochore protein NUF2 [Dictyocoela muelleri]